MRIAIIGAGAIGSLVGGLLAKAGEDVTVIGRRQHVDAVNRNGLRIDGVAGTMQVRVRAVERLDFVPDLALLTMKTQGVAAAARAIRPYVVGVPVVTMQNGVRSDELVAEVLGKDDVLSCVVLLGATFLEPGSVTYSAQGVLVLGVPFGSIDERTRSVAAILDKAVPTHLSTNIAGAHWTKLLINENNALPAVMGISIQEVNRRPALRKLSVLLMKEAAATIAAAGIKLTSLPRLPKTALRMMLSLPTPSRIASAETAVPVAGRDTRPWLDPAERQARGEDRDRLPQRRDRRSGEANRQADSVQRRRGRVGPPGRGDGHLPHG